MNSRTLLRHLEEKKQAPLKRKHFLLFKFFFNIFGSINYSWNSIKYANGKMFNNKLLFVNTKKWLKMAGEHLYSLKMQEMYEYAWTCKSDTTLCCSAMPNASQKMWTLISGSQRRNICRPTSRDCSVTVLVSWLSARKASSHLWQLDLRTSELASSYSQWFISQ